MLKVQFFVEINSCIEVELKDWIKRPLIKKLIESRSTLLDKISSHNNIPYIEFSINCIFHSSSDNPSYSITIYPGDYLIWDEVIHRFVVMQESVFLMLYKESL